MRLGLALRSRISACSRNRLEQLVEVEAGLGRDFDIEHFNRHGFHEHLMLEESVRTFCGLAVGLSILLIATMIGTLGGLGVVDRFDGLRHHAVVGRHHRMAKSVTWAPRATHGGEGRVAGRYR